MVVLMKWQKCIYLFLLVLVVFTGCSRNNERFLYNDGGRIGIGGYDADVISYLKNPPQLYFANVRFIPEFSSINQGGVSLLDDGTLDIGVQIGYDTEDHTPILISYQFDLGTKVLTKQDGADNLLSDQRMLEIAEQLYEIMSFAKENKAKVNLLDSVSSKILQKPYAPGGFC